MSSKDKGKGKAKEVSTGKRKSSAGRCLGGDDEQRRKRKAVLQFFEDTADVDDSDSSDDGEIDNCKTNRFSFRSYFFFFCFSASFRGLAFGGGGLFGSAFLGFCLFLGF